MGKKRKIRLLLLVLGMGFFLSACGKKEESLVIVPETQERETEQEEPQEPDGEVPSPKQEEEPQEKIWVDVAGAVMLPGVYGLPEGSRVFEAVEAAGGFREDADTVWLNQAALLIDGQKIQVYTKEETIEMEEMGKTPAAISADPEGREGKKIDLNLASLEELQEIPGIGEVRAQAILDYREEAGTFESIEEIQQVPGIKGKTFEKIEEYITVE